MMYRCSGRTEDGRRRNENAMVNEESYCKTVNYREDNKKLAYNIV